MSSLTIDIERAERDGIISAEQASALRKAFAAPHEEPVRITGRFSTVFVAIGCAILVYGIYAAARGLGVPPWQGHAVQAVAALALAEAMNRNRMSFTAGACVILAAWAAGQATGGLLHDPLALKRPGDYAMHRLEETASAFLAASAVAWLGLARFRIPFLVLPAFGFAAVALAHYLLAKEMLVSPYALTGIGAVGACLLAAGVRIDRMDPSRSGTPGQYAFWLFVTGSPLTVHPLLVLVLTQAKGLPGSIMALTVITIAGLVTLGGLKLNRRAPVVSTLVYVTLALGYLLESAGVAMMLIGGYVVCLGILWEPARRALGLSSTPSVA